MRDNASHPPTFVFTGIYSILLAALFLANWIYFPATVQGGATEFMALSIAVYLLAHFLRGVRLAVLSVALLGLRFRTGLAVHFLAAPWSLVLPLKLDETIRWGALTRLSGSPFRSVAVLLLDRSADAVVLLLLGVLALSAGWNVTIAVVVAIFIAVVIIAFTFGIAPSLVKTLQRYILLHRSGPQIVGILRIVDRLRRALDFGAHKANETFPFLVVSSILIWAMEIAAIWLMLTTSTSEANSFAEAIVALFSGIVAPSVSMDKIDGSTRLLPLLLLLLLAPGVWAMVRLAPMLTGRQRDDRR